MSRFQIGDFAPDQYFLSSFLVYHVVALVTQFTVFKCDWATFVIGLSLPTMSIYVLLSRMLGVSVYKSKTLENPLS